MSEGVRELTRLLKEARTYWETRHAPLYRGRELEEEKRAELIDLKEKIESQDVAGARAVARNWHSYHSTQGDYADDLTSAARHIKLAEYFAKILDRLEHEQTGPGT